MHHFTFGAYRPGIGIHRAHIADAQVEGGIPLALLEARMDCAAHRRVQQCSRVTAVHCTQWVVMTGVRRALEHKTTGCPFDRYEVQQYPNGRAGQFSAGNTFEKLARLQGADLGHAEGARCAKAGTNGGFLDFPLSEQRFV